MSKCLPFFSVNLANTLTTISQSKMIVVKAFRFVCQRDIRIKLVL